MVVRLIKKFLLARSPTICYRFPPVHRNCSTLHTLTSYTVGNIIFRLRLGLPRGLILEVTLSYFVRTWSNLSVCVTCPAHRARTWLRTKRRLRFATTCKPNLSLRLVIFCLPYHFHHCLFVFSVCRVVCANWLIMTKFWNCGTEIMVEFFKCKNDVW